MSETSQGRQGGRGFQLSTDWWAVLASLTVALLVRVGFIHKVPW